MTVDSIKAQLSESPKAGVRIKSLQQPEFAQAYNGKDELYPAEEGGSIGELERLG